MSVNGYYISRRLRKALSYVAAFGKCTIQTVLPVYANLGEKAEEIASAEFVRLGSEPAGEDCDGEMGNLAEAAEEVGIAFYETMVMLRQASINLYAAGLFHLIEQQLANICSDGAITVPAPDDTKLAVVARWHECHFHLRLDSMPSWSAVDELRLVANTVKHAECRDAEKLRKKRPELFQDPVIRALLPDASGSKLHLLPLSSPLAGDLYVTEKIFQEYSDAAKRFLKELIGYFEEHGDDVYPHEIASVTAKS